MSDVAREAGLSQGIINLHFKTKDRLFSETLRYLADEYKQIWERALKKAGDDPVEKLRAMVELDFSASLCERSFVDEQLRFARKMMKAMNPVMVKVDAVPEKPVRRTAKAA